MARNNAMLIRDSVSYFAVRNSFDLYLNQFVSFLKARNEMINFISQKEFI